MNFEIIKRFASKQGITLKPGKQSQKSANINSNKAQRELLITIATDLGYLNNEKEEV